MSHRYRDIDPFEEYFPGESRKSRCHRKLRRFFSIDLNGYRTRENLKSLTVIKAETLRHLLFYRNSIHCFSQFRFYWEIMMLITYSLAFTVIPYQVAFIYGQKRNLGSTFLGITRAVDVICLMDIAINFLSSFQDHESGNIVLKSSQIAKHYIRGYFWIDFFSTVPDILTWIWEMIDNHHTHPSEHTMECFWEFVAMLSLLKFFQMNLFFKYLVNYLRQRGKSDYFITSIRHTLTIAFCVHLIVCLNFLILRIIFTPFGSDINPLPVSNVDTSFWNETNNAEKYGIILYVITYTLTLFASMVEEKNLTDMTFAFCLTIVGFMLHIWLISKVYLHLRTSYGPSVRYQEMRWELQEYVAFKHIPKRVQKRILTYYDYCFKDEFFRKKEIEGLLGSDLIHIIAKETTEELLKRHFLFMLLPANLLHSIAISMSEVVFLRNDVICRFDRNVGKKLFLIVRGTVAAYTKHGDEVWHLHDGEMFGENEFLVFKKNLTSLNYVAVEECIIYVLNRSDFMRIMAESSEFIDEMREALKIQGSERNTKETMVKFSIF